MQFAAAVLENEILEKKLKEIYSAHYSQNI